MLFALDIGNTNMAAGLYDRDRLVHRWRIATDLNKTGDEHLLDLAGAFEGLGIPPSRVSDAAIACVVPPVLDAVFYACRRLFSSAEPWAVSIADYPGLPVAYDAPRQLGIDRFANAVAAREKYGKPVVVVDCGTATKVEAVSAEGAYLGGAIMPGIGISADALHRRASKLPRAPLDDGDLPAVGRTVAESLRAGLFWGSAGAIDETVRKVKAIVGGRAAVVATGGLSGLVARFSEEVQVSDPDLTLDGIRLIAQERRRMRSAASNP